jgi:hypothetical protein
VQQILFPDEREDVGCVRVREILLSTHIRTLLTARISLCSRHVYLYLYKIRMDYRYRLWYILRLLFCKISVRSLLTCFMHMIITSCLDFVWHVTHHSAYLCNVGCNMFCITFLFQAAYLLFLQIVDFFLCEPQLTDPLRQFLFLHFCSNLRGMFAAVKAK